MATETRERRTADLALAASVPPVPFWATLTAQLSMYGFRVVPSDTWPGLMKTIAALADADARTEPVDESGSFGAALKAAGFTRHENHVRSQDHDYWHACTLGEREKKVAAERGVPVWAIPYDEFEAIALDEELEGVSIARYLFVGTEAELRLALSRAFPG